MLYYWAIFKDCLKKEKKEKIEDKLNDELISLVNNLLRTQREILKYVDLQEEEIRKIKRYDFRFN